MACTAHTATALAPPPAMTRCECTETSFEDLALQMRAERMGFDELTRRTGCGTTCTACLPDLRRFLERR